MNNRAQRRLMKAIAISRDASSSQSTDIRSQATSTKASFVVIPAEATPSITKGTVKLV